MEINRNNVFEIIEKSGLKPDKDYGQNYLLDVSICEKIVSQLDIKDNDSVLEIGPGLGSLTHFISQHNCEITLVDIDSRMIDFLKIIYKKENIKLIAEDIRKHDLKEYTKIIGNLPYNITTETITYLLENAIEMKKTVLMCQAEAFNRFNDLSGKEYGPVSILVHLLGNAKRIMTVKPGSFYPMPKCSSVVFSIEISENVDRNKMLYVYDLAKRLFANRRKTISNNLSNYLGDKYKAEKILYELNIPLNKRPEELSPETFVKIYDCVHREL